jgi:hypothetical protein
MLYTFFDSLSRNRKCRKSVFQVENNWRQVLYEAQVRQKIQMRQYPC